MRKSAAVILGIILSLAFSACTGQQAPQTSLQPSANQKQSNTEINDLNSSDDTQRNTAESEPAFSEIEAKTRKLQLTIDGQEIDITLYNTPAANALYDLLPLDLTFEDFNGVEKIAYMDHELPTQGEPDGCDPAVGDLCLYAPWGNLSIFYQDFRYSDSLIKLGHIDSGMDIISSLDADFSATLERAA